MLNACYMSKASPCYPDAAGLRARIARYNLRRYRVAAAADVSPTALYEWLTGRRELDRLRAERIRAAIERLAAEASI